MSGAGLGSAARGHASRGNELASTRRSSFRIGSGPAVRWFRCPVNDSSCPADATRFTGFSAQIGTGFERPSASIFPSASIINGERPLPSPEGAPASSSLPLAGASPGLWRFRDPTPELSIGPITLLKTAFFFFDQNFAFAGVIGLSDDALQFHALHQRRRAVISDLQPALDVAG
jgi:hypothetical protein